VRKIGERIRDSLQPFCDKYNDDKEWGTRRAHTLAETLFFTDKDIHGTYLLMETLQALHTFLSYMKGSLRAMTPTVAALWDKDFVDCIAKANEEVETIEEWILQQLAITAPQALIVPVPTDQM
jgi:hypothetical protein